MSKASRRAKRERRTRRRRVRWMRLGGVAAVVVIAVGAGLLLFGRAEGSDGGPADFTMVAYQGQNVLGGDRVDFAHLVGHGKPVVLNFWAGLCPPCRAEMPGFQSVYDDLGNDFVMVGVDVGPYVGLGSHDDARAFLRDHGITYPAAYATSASPLQRYAVQGMPTTVIFDAAGTIVTRHTGYFAATAFLRKLRPLLASSR